MNCAVLVAPDGARVEFDLSGHEVKRYMQFLLPNKLRLWNDETDCVGLTGTVTCSDCDGVRLPA